MSVIRQFYKVLFLIFMLKRIYFILRLVFTK